MRFHLLRILLVLSVVLAVAAGLLDSLLPQFVPAAAREAFLSLQSSRPSYGAALMVVALVYWATLLLAIVGMWRARGWGLVLALVATAATVLQAVLLSPHVYSGAAFALSYLGKVCWGAALGLAAARHFKGLAVQPDRLAPGAARPV